MRSYTEIIREINRNYYELLNTGLTDAITLLIELPFEEYENFIDAIYKELSFVADPLTKERPDEIRYMGHVIRPKLTTKFNKY